MATAAGVALNLHNRETITGIFADTLEAGEQTLVDFLLQVTGFQNKRLGLCLGLRENLVQLRTLLVQINGTLLDVLGRAGFVCQTSLELGGVVLDLALRCFDLQFLILNLFV